MTKIKGISNEFQEAFRLLQKGRDLIKKYYKTTRLLDEDIDMLLKLN